MSAEKNIPVATNCESIYAHIPANASSAVCAIRCSHIWEICAHTSGSIMLAQILGEKQRSKLTIRWSENICVQSVVQNSLWIVVLVIFLMCANVSKQKTKMNIQSKE